MAYPTQYDWANTTVIRPIITIEKSADTMVAAPYDTVTYLIWFNNTGFSPISTVWINDTLPNGVTYQYDDNASVTGAFPDIGNPTTQSGQLYGYTFTSVLPGYHCFNITVTVDNNLPNNIILDNWAYLNGTGIPETYDNAQVRTNAPPQQGHLIIGWIWNLSAPMRVTDQSVTVRITNNDTGEWTEVTSDSLGRYYVDLSNTANFPSGYILGQPIYVQAWNSTASGVNWTTVSSGPRTWCNVTLRGRANITVEKAVNQTSAVAGAYLNYTVWINNTGGGNAAIVYVNDTLPGWCIYLDDNASDIGPYTMTQVGSVLQYEFYDLPPGNYYFNISVQVNPSTPATTLINNVTAEYSDASNVTMFDGGWDTASTTISGSGQISHLIIGFARTSTGVPITSFTLTLYFSANDHINATADDYVNVTVHTDSLGRYIVDLANMYIDDGHTYYDGENITGACTAYGYMVWNTTDDLWVPSGAIPGGSWPDPIGKVHTAQHRQWMNFTFPTGIGNPNVTINKTVNNTPTYPGVKFLVVNPGDYLNYSIWFNNSGGVASILWINDTLPVNIIFIGHNATDVPYFVAPGYSWFDGQWHLQFNFTNVPNSDDGWWFNITVQVDPAAAGGLYTNNATANVTNQAHVPQHDSNATIFVPPPGPSKQYINKTANATAVFPNGDTDPLPVYPGDTVYFIVWFNTTGPTAYLWINDTFPLYDVQYTDNNASDLMGVPFPYTITNVEVWWEASTRTLHVNLTGIPENPGGWWFWIEAQVNDSVVDPIHNYLTGNHTNNATIVNTTGLTDVYDTATLNILIGAPVGSITLNKSANLTADYPNPFVDPLPVNPGDVFYYIFWFNNSGPTVNLWLNDTLPVDVQYTGFHNATDVPYFVPPGYSWFDGVQWHLQFNFTAVPTNEDGWWFWVRVRVNTTLEGITNWGTTGHQNIAVINWTDGTQEVGGSDDTTIDIIPEYDTLFAPILGTLAMLGVAFRQRKRKNKTNHYICHYQ